MLVLASRSPRRSEILRAAGIRFTVRPADIAEAPRPGETPDAYVRRLAEEKADVAGIHDGEIVLGADTVVVVAQHILEKPADPSDAARMLRVLSGREHFVLTGVCLRGPEKKRVDTVSTSVRFAPLSEDEIAEYVASGEPMDKAGAYAIQGLACRFVERIEGDYFNVVGLPISLIYRRLREIGELPGAGRL